MFKIIQVLIDYRSDVGILESGWSTAVKIITSSVYNKLRIERYSSFDSGKGKEFEVGKLDLKALYEIAKENGELRLQSGKQELFENIINQHTLCLMQKLLP